MKISEFIKDKKVFFIAYFLNMVFVNLIVYLDVLSVSKSSLYYLDILSFVILAISMFFLYIKEKQVFKILKNNTEEEIFNPESLDFEHSIIGEVYKDFYISYYKYINKEYNKLSKKQQLFTDYITSWVHSVKTPLTASKLMIENDVESNSSTLNKVEEELEQILHYTEQALYYVRLDSFTKDYLITESNIKKLIMSSIKKHSRTFITKKISVNIDVDEIKVLTDEKWIIFVINQIIYNSLKYTDTGGTIAVKAVQSGDKIILTLKDNGCGIKEEDINRVFDRGFTGYNGRKYEHSTGMGLYLAKELCSMLGHKIEISSKFGEYTNVTIKFNKAGYYSNIRKL